MFGLSRLLSGVIIAALVMFWSFVAYRVVEHVHLKEQVAQQTQVIQTVDNTAKAVQAAQVDLSKSDLNQALCAKGWQANCEPTGKPDIARLRFVEMASVDSTPSPEPAASVTPVSQEVAPAPLSPSELSKRLADCKDAKCRADLRSRNPHPLPKGKCPPAAPDKDGSGGATPTSGPNFGVLLHGR